jgi:hypothetical protein
LLQALQEKHERILGALLQEVQENNEWILGALLQAAQENNERPPDHGTVKVSLLWAAGARPFLVPREVGTYSGPILELSVAKSVYPVCVLYAIKIRQTTAERKSKTTRNAVKSFKGTLKILS